MEMCKWCGASVSPNDVVCARCGARLKRESKPCPRCGREARFGLIVCPYCGEELWGKRRPWKLVGALVGIGVVVVLAYVVLTFVPLPFELPFVASAPTSTPTEVILPPTPTATNTPRPPTATPTLTATATFTPVITATVTVTGTATVTGTVSPGPAQTPTATPTETPSSGYAAPTLIEPEDQSDWLPDQPLVFSYGARIELKWGPVGTLAEDEWYAVDLTYINRDGASAITGGWTKETMWLVPSDLYELLGGDRDVNWTVTVVSGTPGSGAGTPVSPPSETWMFRWG